MNRPSKEKEKLLVTSNFSFSHNVFHSYILSLQLQNAAMCGNGLTKQQNYRLDQALGKDVYSNQAKLNIPATFGIAAYLSKSLTC